MPREQTRVLLNSIIDMLSEISVGGGEFLPVGDGTDPNHETPYLVVRQISGFGATGPPTDTDADMQTRIQVTGVGDTREQADFARDHVRVLFTKQALNAQFVTDGVPRSVLTLDIDVSRTDRWDRGTSLPRYGAVDQYILHTTPA